MNHSTSTALLIRTDTSSGRSATHVHGRRVEAPSLRDLFALLAAELDDTEPNEQAARLRGGLDPDAAERGAKREAERTERLRAREVKARADLAAKQILDDAAETVAQMERDALERAEQARLAAEERAKEEEKNRWR